MSETKKTKNILKYVLIEIFLYMSQIKEYFFIFSEFWLRIRMLLGVETQTCKT